jgi:hypothetical protein
MELATPLIPTSAIAALPRSRSHSRSPHIDIMGYNSDNDNMHLHSPRVNDSANFEFDDPPSFPPPLSPPIGYLIRREGASPSTTGHSSTFPNLSLSAFPMPPSSATALPPPSSAVPLPPSLSRTTSRGRELTSGQEESRERGEGVVLNGERGEGRERMDGELEGVQGMLGEAGIALSEVRLGWSTGIGSDL